ASGAASAPRAATIIPIERATEAGVGSRSTARVIDELAATLGRAVPALIQRAIASGGAAAAQRAAAVSA
ncbi:MAG TPA: hypothetical protein VGS61_00970, partial [Acidimicrobiales bacterium]|nr:hypothetical protein [Acidimicrobiales bacterium]